jgi:predicted type IV restriction endonuclease
MDFIEQLQNLANKTEKLCSLLQTEEATKNALIMPFINILGYDIFDPTEVIPEFIADVGIRKGEKVDYAIKKDGKIIMLFECKHCGGDLNINHASQLFRYFAVTDARIAVLTNGLKFRFFTDLEAPNKMDEKPFFEFDMTELDEVAITELKKLTKQAFNIDEIIVTAGELKYTRQIKKILAQQIENPSDEFVKSIASSVFSGVLNAARREYFAGIVKRAFNQLVNERINDRLKSVMAGGAAAESEAEMPTAPTRQELIETTAEELEGFYIVKSLLRDLVDPKRIIHRDTQSYMGILLDDNNRKPLARLYFNRSQKYLGTFDEKREEEKVAIQNLNDIYQYGDKLRRVFAFYEKESGDGSTEENK